MALTPPADMARVLSTCERVCSRNKTDFEVDQVSTLLQKDLKNADLIYLL